MSTEPSPVPTSSVRESGASANVRASADGWRSKRSAPERASHAITVDPWSQQPRANRTRLSWLNCNPPAPKRTLRLNSGRPDGSSRTSTNESAAPGACRCAASEPPVGGDGGPRHGIGVAQAVQDGAARRIPDRDAPGCPAGREPAAVGREREPGYEVPVAGRQRADEALRAQVDQRRDALREHGRHQRTARVDHRARVRRAPVLGLAIDEPAPEPPSAVRVPQADDAVARPEQGPPLGVEHDAVADPPSGRVERLADRPRLHVPDVRALVGAADDPLCRRG